MDYKNRGSAGYRDREIRPTRPDMGNTEQRGLRPVSKATSAFNPIPARSPGSVSGAWIPKLTLAEENWVTGESRLRSRLMRRRVLRSDGRRATLPPNGPPWLFGYALYHPASEEIDQLIRSSLFELDEATSKGVLLTYIGNPREVGPVYDMLRD